MDTLPEWETKLLPGIKKKKKKKINTQTKKNPKTPPNPLKEPARGKLHSSKRNAYAFLPLWHNQSSENIRKTKK